MVAPRSASPSRALARVLLATAVLFTTRAHATVVALVDFDSQCARAAHIFVGTVETVSSRPDPRAPGYFETLVRFSNDETIAGTVPATVELSLAGGDVGGMKQVIDGMPQFAPGERYVVFLEPDADPPLVSPIVGFNQGLYRVLPHPATAERDVVRDQAGNALASGVRARAEAAAALATTPAAPGATALAPGGAEIDLDTFVAAIRATRRR